MATMLAFSGLLDFVNQTLSIQLMGLLKQPITDLRMPHRQFRTRTGWLSVIALALLVFISLFWDLDISRFATSIKIPGDLRKAIHLCEAFAHFSGVVAILGALLMVDTKNRAKLVQVCVLVSISGVASNAAKYLIPRIRPHAMNKAPFPIQSGWETWGVPGSGSWFEEALRSFPSGHSATAVALAIGLSYVYPRGRWVFAILAFMACLQRLVSGAHFLSDIMAGSGIAILTSLAVHRYAFLDVSAVKTAE